MCLAYRYLNCHNGELGVNTGAVEMGVTIG
jgi:hypothetical protein